MRRRDFLKGSAIAAGLASFPLGWCASQGDKKKRILFFTKSSGFEHSVIKRNGASLSHAEKILTDLGQQHGFDVVCSKDGRLFVPQELAKFDALFFYTTGDLTKPSKDGGEPMPLEGKTAFLNAIKSGMGFIGGHTATNTFMTEPRDPYKAYGTKVDPFIAMLGGEFIRHDKQQKATLRVVDSKFPGMQGLGEKVELFDEWYSIKDFAPDLHVLLVQETAGMEGPHYKRPPYPMTWARMHGKGRVFHTSLGHREDIWTNPTFHKILLGGIAWALKNVEAEIAPNIKQVTPEYTRIPSSPEKS